MILRNTDKRRQKAKKVLNIIEDYCKLTNIDLKKIKIIDVGGSVGYIAETFSTIEIKKFISMDIDFPAILWGKNNLNISEKFNVINGNQTTITSTSMPDFLNEKDIKIINL